ncbi:MAG: right-handed parallel beta-helix repeat-containing protein [Magnetococcales bacterium]|nr:right-handed parallel beta-helix repeat-containing protein [Magnetococcales bacterium]
MMIFRLLLLCLLSTLSANATAAVLHVGPGSVYSVPSQAANVAKDGDIITIQAGSYKDCAVWKANKLIIRGIGGMPIVKDKMCHGKAIWVVTGDHIIVDTIAFSGMKVRDRNGAGVRIEGRDLTIRNALFQDGESGVLGGGQRPDDHIVIENSRFVRLGRNGQAHPIYINHASMFTLSNSIVQDCLNEANCVKSRAHQNIIVNNVIDSRLGDSSWEIDIPNGGKTEIEGNLIIQSEKSVNRGLLGYAMEYTPADRNHTLIIRNNLFINDQSKGRFIDINRHLKPTITAHNNGFVGPGRISEKVPAQTDNDFFNSRAETVKFLNINRTDPRAKWREYLLGISK